MTLLSEVSIQGGPSRKGGKFVEVNGHRLYVNCRGKGLPVVVLEAGLDANSASFNAVHAGVARFTRVCSYDRLNLGLSEHAPDLRTSENSVDDLHALLDQLNVPKQYVLVGASIGGIIVRLFARRYPSESLGMVLVDSTPEDLLAQYQAALSPEQYNEIEAGNNNEQIQVQKSLSEALAPLWRNDIPLIVLAHDPALGRPPAERERAWGQMQVELATRSKKGELRVVNGSSHVMTRDKPAAIIKAVKDVVNRIRSGG